MGNELDKLGEYVVEVRKKYGVPVREICAEKNMSSSTYSRLIKGQVMVITHYFRTFGYVVDMYGENKAVRDKYYATFFEIGIRSWKEKEEKEKRERKKERESEK